MKAAPIAASDPNWSGIYAGVTAGGVWGRSKDTFNDPGSPALFGREATSSDLTGFIGGGTLGANWQFGNVVWGVEADGSWTSAVGRSNLVPPFITTTTLEARERWLVTARGRVGYATGRWLIYATGGGAWADIRYTATNAAGSNDISSGMVSGWTAGGGVETRLAGDWSVKAEYLYIDFSDKNFFTAIASGGPSGTQRMDVNNHIARVGVNYRFVPFAAR